MNNWFIIIIPKLKEKLWQRDVQLKVEAIWINIVSPILRRAASVVT